MASVWFIGSSALCPRSLQSWPIYVCFCRGALVAFCWAFASGDPHIEKPFVFVADQQIFFTLQAEILRAFTAFATETLERFYPELHINPGVAQVPIIVSSEAPPADLGFWCYRAELSQTVTRRQNT